MKYLLYLLTILSIGCTTTVQNGTPYSARISAAKEKADKCPNKDPFFDAYYASARNLENSYYPAEVAYLTGSLEYFDWTSYVHDLEEAVRKLERTACKPE